MHRPRRATARCFAAALAVLLFLTAPSPSPLRAEDKDRVESLEAEAAARQKELEGLKTLLDEEKKRLASISKKERSVLDLLDEAEREIDKLVRERAKLEKRISALEKDVSKTRVNLKEKRIALERERKRLAKRLVGLYKLGPVGSMRVLLSAESVFDFQRRRYYLGRILGQDAARVETYLEGVAELAALEHSLTTQLAELDVQRAELGENRRKAVVERDNRLRIVQAVRRQRESYEQVVGELAQQSEELEKLLDLIQRRIKSRILLGKAESARVGFAEFRGSLLPPVKGPVLSRFGRHVNERFGTVTFNNGIEIGAKEGTPIEAVSSGVVIFADRFKGYGNLIIIDHGDGYYSLYAHCERLKKGVGDPVEAREVVAWVGESSALRGPACYFEIRLHGGALDPAQWLLIE